MQYLTFITDILERAGIRPTPVRQLILKTLLDGPRPLSSLEIERNLETVDRSSITRTLILFVDRGVVHSFEDGSGSMKYEACRDKHHADHSPAHSSDSLHTDLHPHFHCTKCGITICLDYLSIPDIPLPAGFDGQSRTLIVKGLCDKCNQ
ncbi:MAG: transcriptional repressor [Muribaculaceae bacterium]|nr:transcriptional repressor [Muribaculaceae bacterium]